LPFGAPLQVWAQADCFIGHGNENVPN